jgi:hypothetical protein
MSAKSALLFAAAMAASGLAGSAYADTWSNAYGGTVESTYTDGRMVKVYINADHTYLIKKPDGTMVVKGTWADADASGQTCFMATDPPPPPNAKPICFAAKDHQIGDSWPGEDPSGKFTSVLKAGR